MNENSNHGLFARLKDAIFNRVTKEPASSVGARYWSPSRTLAGVSINEDSALSLSAFHAAVRYLSQTIGTLPWHVMREIPGGAEVAYSHPVERILNDRPSPEYSSQSLREVMTSWAIRYGNAVAEIEPDQVDRPIGLHPMHPDRVQFRRAETPFADAYGDDIGASELFYLIDGQTALAARRVFHIRGFGDGPIGMSVVSYAAQSLGWAKAAQMFGAAFYGNGTHLGGVISNKLPLSKEALALQKAEVDAAHRGPGRAHGTLHLDADSTYTPFSPKLSDSQFVEIHQHLVEEVCRWVGVPPSKVMHLLHAHYNNVEHESINVVVDSITPWAKRFEAEADYKLFGQNRRGYFSRMNLRGLLRGDFKAQNEGLEIMRRNGVLSADEWREFVDMNPIGPEAGGDLRIVQAAQIELAKVGTNFSAGVDS